jgi:glyoxylase-like metal-dependent hydrolase (beta-lactamase superfamily II)
MDPLTTSIQVGHVRVTALLDGSADLLDTPITDAFPGAPPDRLLDWRSRAPRLHGPGDTWHLIVRAFLVQHPGGTMLVDTGLGLTGVTMSWFPRPGRLLDALSAAGLKPAHVDTVVLTHVHDDHIGGTVTSEGGPVFRNARHLLQTADLATLRAEARESEEGQQIFDGLIRPLQDEVLLDTVDGDAELTPLLRLRAAPGHTPGHQVLQIVSEGQRMLVSADTWLHPAQLAHPDWASAADGHPAAAAETRRALLAELLSHPGTTLAPTHFSEAFGRVGWGSDGLARWNPASD